MNAHRVHILDGADDDAVVRLVADDFHLVFLPAEHAFLDKHLVHGARIEAAFDDVGEFLFVVGDAAARAAKREGGADDGGQAYHLECVHRLFHVVDELGARAFEADAVHRVAEELAVFRHLDRLALRADHLDAEFLQHAHIGERQRGVERGLAAHGRQQRVGPLLLDDLRDDLGRDRLDIGRVRELGVRHDRGGVRVHEDDAVALIP